MWGLLLSKPARWGIVGLLAFGVLAHDRIQTARLKHTRADLVTAKALLYVPGFDGKPTKVTWQQKAELAEGNLTVCRLNVQELNGSVERQNLAVEAFKAESDLRARQVADAVRTAQKDAMAAQSAAERILGTRMTDDDQCERLKEAERAISGATR